MNMNSAKRLPIFRPSNPT